MLWNKSEALYMQLLCLTANLDRLTALYFSTRSARKVYYQATVPAQKVYYQATMPARKVYFQATVPASSFRVTNKTFLFQQIFWNQLKCAGPS